MSANKLKSDIPDEMIESFPIHTEIFRKRGKAERVCGVDREKENGLDNSRN